jgi:hypothetical protein
MAAESGQFEIIVGRSITVSELSAAEVTLPGSVPE